MSSMPEEIFPLTLAFEEVRTLLSGKEGRAALQAGPAGLSSFLKKSLPPRPGAVNPADIAAVEYALHEVKRDKRTQERPGRGAVINPVLQLVEVTGDVSSFFPATGEGRPPSASGGWVAVWKGPETGRVYAEAADEQMLLALKVLLEDSPGGLTGRELRAVNLAIDHAARKGIVIKAPYLTSRTLQGFPEGEGIAARYRTASAFTLQWHITNACDLHCSHCYDRQKRSPLTAGEGLAVIDDFERFCDRKNVRAHICFSGGNPFLSPHFFTLYGAAAGKGMATSVLGNPVSEEELLRCIDLQMPEYFQVSLEGLEEHNDLVRGKGYFKRVAGFLDLLRKHDVPSAVMLTLTERNMRQVLPLAEYLREKTGFFTFNRLSQVGEGAGLPLPDPAEYRRFLEEYAAAARESPVIGIKENLINILRREEGIRPFGGCTGFGCGAAFNFLALLPDGEVHACRKFPSPLGRISESDFLSIYDSREAARYRDGSAACSACDLRPVCGGCMAVVHGMGLDPFRDRDPFCFHDEQGRIGGAT